LFKYEFEDGTDRPLLPADDGAWSIEGMAHAAIITAHYVFEGRVRLRAPYSDKFRLYIAPPRAGSWTTDFMLAMQRPDVLAGAVAGFGLSTVPGVFRLFKRLANRATGVESGVDISQRFEDERTGDFDALVEAVEPSLVRAHRVISERRTTVKASLGPAHFTFDRRTKAYIENIVTDQRETSERVNVASYNVNRRTGRVYFERLQRTVPFTISREAPPRTEIALGRSLDNYATNRMVNRDIDITYRAKRAEKGGRIKSIVIYDAQFIFGVRA